MYCDCFVCCVSCTVVVLTCFVMRGCFGDLFTCIYCVLCCLYCVFCIVSFMYIYSYLFCLYYCKDYCHRVTTELQLMVVIIIITSKFFNPGSSIFSIIPGNSSPFHLELLEFECTSLEGFQSFVRLSSWKSMLPAGSIVGALYHKL